MGRTELLRTSAVINAGNFCGLKCNFYGEAVGVVSWIMSPRKWQNLVVATRVVG
jgi:hypothetical protein